MGKVFYASDFDNGVSRKKLATPAPAEQPAETPEAVLHTPTSDLAGFSDQQLADELRARGYVLTAEKQTVVRI